MFCTLDDSGTVTARWFGCPSRNADATVIQAIAEDTDGGLGQTEPCPTGSRCAMRKELRCIAPPISLRGSKFLLFRDVLSHIYLCAFMLLSDAN